MKTAIIALALQGRETASKIRAKLVNAEIYLPQKIADGREDFAFEVSVKTLISQLFDTYPSLICIMASGIVVRSIAPYLQHKSIDPAVVVVDEAGHFAIPLLSGHLGGANALAEKVAGILAGQAVLTTASDVQGVLAVEIWGQKYGLTIENFSNLAILNGAIVNDQKVAVVSDWPVPKEARDLGHRENTVYFTNPKLERDVHDVVTTQSLLNQLMAENTSIAFITDKQLPASLQGISNLVILRPQTLIIGLGMRKGIEKQEIAEAVGEAFQGAGLAMKSIIAFASIEEKREEPGLQAYLYEYGQTALPQKGAYNFQLQYFFSKADLAEKVTQYNLTESAFVKEQMGVGSVCEAAALAVRENSQLILNKQKLGRVTVAIARAPFTWSVSDRAIR